jgi:hypothetical protein
MKPIINKLSTGDDYIIDKSGWPEGPWLTEPDKVEWRAHGMACLIVRVNHGALCGYVGVPEGHPLHGKDLQMDLNALDCHGGVTFNRACDPGGKVCHVAQPGEPGHLWWIGFDCAHFGDLMPAHNASLASLGLPQASCGVYRDLEYVKNEVEGLARQLSE